MKLALTHRLHRLAVVAVVALAPVAAIAAGDHANMPGMNQTQQSSAATVLTDGEVKKVDTDQGKITIRHGPIENLGMPGMTMVFRVADPAMFSRFQAGDAIKFAADRVNGTLTVTRLEPRK